MKENDLRITRISTIEIDFKSRLEACLKREMLDNDEIYQKVTSVLEGVRQQGDIAVLEYTNKFDNFSVESFQDLVVTPNQLEDSLKRIPDSQRNALEHAANRIQKYHERQVTSSWQYEDEDGSVLGQKVTPLERVGIYVPGGKANYPSSMLMLAIPARVAGVKDIIAAVPTRYDTKNDLIFAAAKVAGVNQVLTMGGAQAVGALAYGTETLKKVDKIAGPGNVYVNVAKRMVFGQVGIDMVAGPSELTVICDGTTDPDWIAADLFSQAEHDEFAQSILISPSEECLDQVERSIRAMLPKMDRREIIEASLKNRGIFIHVDSIEQAAEVSNDIAPEHLEISINKPESIVPMITNAGAIFLGRYSAEALGDYCAGPSHVLPTSGTSRFFSALGVCDFQKRSSIISCSQKGASKLAETASILARNENLQAHAVSAEFRLHEKLN